MFYSKGLVLKGLLGFGATSSAVYVGLSQKERIAGWFSGNEETAKPEASTEEISKLLDEVGLSCDLTNASAEAGVDCSKKTGEGVKIKVKQGDKTFDLSDITSPGKIKVYKDDGYDNKFKFVIEDGDISQSNDKLEQFETYEISKHSGANYLTRKYKSSEAKRRLLGLPDSCEFPETAGQTKTCNLTTTEDINNIKFDGKTNVSLSGGSVSLKVEVTPSTETSNFPHGFKFTLTPSGGSLTINRSGGNITIADGKATEFKIKKTGSSLSLEEALTKDVLTAKVGLTCTGTPNGTTGIDCTKTEGGSNIKVKQDGTEFNLSSLPTSGGKIKLYKAEGSEDYNGGLKFVIEEGDITGNNSDKLEEFETYEIKQDGADWKLNRKKKSWEEKRRILGLPDSCAFPETTGQTQCDITSSNINNIKFENKSGTPSITGNGTLKITVASSDEATDFPLGYKFTLTPTGGNLTINRSGNAGNITITDGKSKEFKIKKSGTSLTLEEAWTLEKLTEKVNLSCTASSGAPSESTGVECTKKTGSSGNIKVKKGGTSLEVSEVTGGKIKVYKTSASEDHNEGFKFVIEGGDISGTNGGNNKLEQFETYEIKKESDGWKLNRKTEAKDGIKKALGLDQIEGCDLPKQDGCQVDGEKFKKIKFDGGNTGGENGPSGAKLKITAESGQTEYPFGYKFVLDSTTDATISSSLTIKGNTNTEFKIKKTDGSNALTLEKAWTVKSLGEKVGLICPEDVTNGTKECTLKESSVNLKMEESKKYTGLSKKNGGDGGEKKVKFELDKDGFNQGFRFYTEEAEGITLQNGSSDSDEDKKIENGSNSYQILKDGDNWYLTKKN